MVAQAIFLPGKMCGDEYLIVRLHSRSPVSESYIARHKATRRHVLLTCSRFSHDPSGPPISTAFIANAARLSQIHIDNTPRVLDSGIDAGVYWVVREHFDDAIPLVSFMTEADVGTERLAELQAQLKAEPYKASESLVLDIGLALSDTLRQFAEKGLLHGGLDPHTTIALRGDGTPIVLDTGYRYLFGESHFTRAPDAMDLRAPEQKAGGEPDMRGDIFTLGLILSGLLSNGSRRGNNACAPALAVALNKAANPDPNHRTQSWKSFYTSLLLVQGSFSAGTKEGNEFADEDAPTPSSGAAPDAPTSGTRSQVDFVAAPPTSRVPEVPHRLVDISDPTPPPANDIVPEGSAAETSKAPVKEGGHPENLPIKAAVKSAAKGSKHARWQRWGAALTLIFALGWLLDVPVRGPTPKARPILRSALTWPIHQAEPGRTDEVCGVKAPDSSIIKRTAVAGAIAAKSHSKYRSGCGLWAACAASSERSEGNARTVAALGHGAGAINDYER